MNSAVKQSLPPQGGPTMATPNKVPLAGQNLTAHGASAAHPAPPVPSMAPVTPNMAQMAHNMSHHGNLSLLNNATPAPSPGKNPTPLEPQPLALTRTSDKKETDTTGQSGQSNGTVEPKPATNAAFKPQNVEPNKEKLDIAKTSPSTPKPPEKIIPNTPSTPQKAEQANASQADGPSQPKVATANEAPEKSPAKPSEPKPEPTADVAPTQSNSKPLPESANNNQVQEKPVPVNAIAATATFSAATASAPIASAAPVHASPTKPEPVVESAKAEPAKPVDEKEEVKVAQSPNKPQIPVETKKEEVKPAEAKKEEPKPVKKDDKPPETPKKEPQSQPTATSAEKATPPKPEEKKPEKTAAEKKQEPKATPKSTLKLATVTPAMRKRRQASPKVSDGTPPAKKPAEGEASTPDSRSKRNRTKVQLYQSPTPELTMATKLSASAGRSTPTKPGDDKLIVFYKNEYLAVRNAEGGFYVCQAMQNVYRTTRKIKIRWLSQDKQADPKGETYKPDFYDVTDMETVLTTLSLSRAAGGGGGWVLKPAEQARAANILRRALQAERGENALLSPEHPDGLDLSLYTDEAQLEKRSPRKRAAAKSDADAGSAEESSPPAKKAAPTPKRSPKSARKAKPSPKPTNTKKAAKPAGSTPVVASTSKTATALSEKGKAKTTPPKRSPAKKEPVKEVATPSPARQGRRSAVKESKPSPAPAPVPSTSTGKSTRTPRKPPAHK